MTLAVFHDLPGLENGLTKFHDFPGRVVTLCLATKTYPTQRARNDTVTSSAPSVFNSTDPEIFYVQHKASTHVLYLDLLHVRHAEDRQFFPQSAVNVGRSFQPKPPLLMSCFIVCFLWVPPVQNHEIAVVHGCRFLAFVVYTLSLPDLFNGDPVFQLVTF